MKASPRTYYNEHDPQMAAWLRELMTDGHIPNGTIDTRSITDVRPRDLAGFTACHFFAGIGGWALALQLAGWPPDVPVWTGSCPCQPFSSAGAQRGFADPRHLWPSWYRLLRHRREPSPVAIFGEQAARATAWMSLVCDDLEAEGFAVCPVVLGAHSAGAPHLRERFYFVADDAGKGRDQWTRLAADEAKEPTHDAHTRRGRHESPDRRAANRRALADHHRRDARQSPDGAHPHRRPDGRHDAEWRSGLGDSWLVNDSLARLERHARHGDPRHKSGRERQDQIGSTATAGGVDWLACSDGVARPTQSGLLPLAHGVPARVGRLRGYGNAIVPTLAAAFVSAYLDTKGRR